MLGVNWLRSNRINWDFAKDLLIVNGEVFDMILEEKSQKLKRKRWLEERNKNNENERDEKKTKMIKVNETDEVKVIDRIWALPMESEINVNKVVCVYRAPFVGDIHPNNIRYPCFVCGPTTKGFSRARDLVKHSVCNHNLFFSGVQQGHSYTCNGSDLITASPEQLDKCKEGSHRGKKKLEEVEKAEAARMLAEAITKGGENGKRQAGGSASKEVDVGEMLRRREVQVELQKAGKAEVRKREELLEEEKIGAEKNNQGEKQKRVREENKKKVREEWLVNVK